MSEDFLADCQRYVGRAVSGRMELFRLLTHFPGLRALWVYRFGKRLQQDGRSRPLAWAAYRLMSAYIRGAYDIWLDLSADIGPGFYIGHLGNIHIARCRIGSCCSVGQSSHIIGPEDGEWPELGDRVWFGAHACLEGSFKVGRGCTVSAGALVNRDLPAGALCLGNPVRVVMMRYDNSAFLRLPPEADPDEAA
jgi:serine O-acetyltransferase